MNTQYTRGSSSFNSSKETVEYHDKKPLIVSDPIMGDDGELYPGLS